MKSLQNELCLFVIMFFVGISKGKIIFVDNVSSNFFLFYDTECNFRVKKQLVQNPKGFDKFLAMTEGF